MNSFEVTVLTTVRKKIVMDAADARDAIAQARSLSNGHPGDDSVSQTFRAKPVPGAGGRRQDAPSGAGISEVKTAIRERIRQLGAAP